MNFFFKLIYIYIFILLKFYFIIFYNLFFIRLVIGSSTKAPVFKVKAGYYGQNKDSNRGRLLAGYGSRWANKGIMVM